MKERPRGEEEDEEGGGAVKERMSGLKEVEVERGGRLGRNRTKIYSTTTSPPNTTAWQASLY